MVARARAGASARAGSAPRAADGGADAHADDGGGRDVQQRQHVSTLTLLVFRRARLATSTQ